MMDNNFSVNPYYPPCIAPFAFHPFYGQALTTGYQGSPRARDQSASAAVGAGHAVDVLDTWIILKEQLQGNC